MKWFKIILISFLLFILLPPVKAQKASGKTAGFPKTFSRLPVTGKKKNMSRLNNAERVVQFIGHMKDSLTFGNLDIMEINSYASSITSARLQEEPMNADSGLVVIIDTNQVITVEENNYSNRITTTAKYDAYPVIVKNISGKKLSVGSGRKIPVYIEALDANNDWRTIENDWTNTHPGGAAKIILKPDDVIGIGIPIYSGNFKTLLRIRVFDNYSEPFTGYINLSQFTETGR